MINALSVDVEDYFHVTSFSKSIRKEAWNRFRPHVIDNTTKILDLLDSRSKKATFFILGWVAEKSPSLVKEIARRGHEVASHGYEHQLIYNIGPVKFKEDIKQSKRLLEDISGRQVIGYRAPSYSITRKSYWALDILIEEGFLYDSSIFPIIHDVYGIPGSDRFPHEIRTASGTIKEFPISTLKLSFLGMTYALPVGGGGYLRLFPAWFIKYAIRHINEKDGKPAIIYFHPWEIDLKQPLIRSDLGAMARHYLNISSTMRKIGELLDSFKFGPIREVLNLS